jgi:hypothetical protein
VDTIPAKVGDRRKVKMTLSAGVFDGTEPIAASVWPGDDRAQSFAPTVTWLSAEDRTITVEWAGSATASMAPGRYLMELRIGSGSDAPGVNVAYVDLQPSPGSGTAPKVYCTLDDMRRVAPWIDQVQTTSDQAGFAEQRAMARVDFDRVVQTRYVGAEFDRESSLDQFLDGLPEYEAGEDDATLQAWLDDDRLVTTGPTGEQVKRWNAYAAVAHVCMAQIGTGPDNQYSKRAAYFTAKADELLCGMTIGIDTTEDEDGEGDGVGDIWIPLGRTRTIRR